MGNALPKDITSYDLLKTFAVIIMVIDHIGHYFFPDLLWWKAVGRIGFPVWFFLVGYARGRDLPMKLMAGAGILTVGNFIVGMAIFPLNALFTIAFIRVSIDWFMRRGLQSEKSLWVMAAILFVCVLPSYIVSEYGLQALITAIFGYLVRHRETVNNDKLIVHYMVFALGSFVFYQQIGFLFDREQFLFMAIGTAVVRMFLYYFKPMTFPQVRTCIRGPVFWFLQFCGRRTLEIYVVHLMFFKFLALYLGIEGFGLFEWHWY